MTMHRFDPIPLVLEGRHVRLEPLARKHAEDLFKVGRDDDIWRFMPRSSFESVSDAGQWIEEALAAASGGTEIPFAIVFGADVVGSTRYLDIRRKDRGLEIGWTWLGKNYQRTIVNSECKYLLLEHGFDRLGAIRVQLKTDARNSRAQRAIERLGAQREGQLRRHLILSDGYVRDSVYYSILDSEWGDVKRQLEALMRRRH